LVHLSGGRDLHDLGALNGGIDTGWTFYTPYSTSFSNSYVVAAGLGIFINGFSSILTGLNFIVTIHTMRAPGMTWFRLPLFVWSHYATSVIMVLGTPVIAITILLVALERIVHIGIFDPRLGGDPVLFQHFFWFYSHPAVYIMILPSMGVVSELISTHSRKNIFGYSFVAFSSLAIACLRLPRLGASPVHVEPIGLCGDDLLVRQFRRGDSVGGESFQLDGDSLQRFDLLRHADALCARFHRAVHYRWIDRTLPRRARIGRAFD
jgi:hypothetical protein